MKGFFNFIREQGIIGLAVAFIFGTAVTKLVTAFITDLINPILGLILGVAGGLKNAYFTLGSAKFLYGDFISSLIDFTIIAAIVYFCVKFLRLDRLDKTKSHK